MINKVQEEEEEVYLESSSSSLAKTKPRFKVAQNKSKFRLKLFQLLEDSLMAYSNIIITRRTVVFSYGISELFSLICDPKQL